MGLHTDDILKADLGKLHNEVNQFRNQEFWVCSFAIGILGATVEEIRSSPLVGLGILGLLFGLFLWHYTLIDTRSRLTSYLKATSGSQWEILYRDFADKIKYPSQRRAAAVTFLVLGLLVPLAAFSDGINAIVENEPYVLLPNWAILYFLFEGTYCFLVWYFGWYKNPKNKLAKYELTWKTILESRPETTTTLTRRCTAAPPASDSAETESVRQGGLR